MSQLNYTEYTNSVELNEDYGRRECVSERTESYHVYLTDIVISVTRAGGFGSKISFRDLEGVERFAVPADKPGVAPPMNFGKDGLWIDGGHTSADAGPGLEVIAVPGADAIQPYAWVYYRAIVTTKDQRNRTFKLDQ